MDSVVSPSEQLDTATVLLESGARPNGNGHETGTYPLEGALTNCSPSLAILLLRHGADPNILCPVSCRLAQHAVTTT
jgi:hypothetical protein